jgi:anti-sigma regulatory factor (Ser/Thr protein kinase)
MSGPWSPRAWALDAGASRGLRHEALLYDGDEELIERAAEFVRVGMERREPVLVVLSTAKLARLRSELNGAGAHVQFADMTEIGRNPARIIEAWKAFVAEHRGTSERMRGIGEPIHPDRDVHELAECHRHEALLNLALGDDPVWLVCPYDTSTLDATVIEDALRNHPYVTRGTSGSNARYAAPEVEFDEALAPLPPPDDELEYEYGTLHAMRRFVAAAALRCGFGEEHVDAIVLAANEVASNSLRHGGGHGTLRVWTHDGSIVCELRDGGRIEGQALLGRIRPEPGQAGGHGLWLANQLCDLVQVRSGPDGTVVRLHLRCAAPSGS